jgi:hypothetical protein
MKQLMVNRDELVRVLKVLGKRVKSGSVSEYVAFHIAQPGILTLYHTDNVAYSIVRMDIDPETQFPNEMIFNLKELFQFCTIGLEDDITIVIKDGDPYFLLDSGIVFLSTYTIDLDQFQAPSNLKLDVRLHGSITINREDFLDHMVRLKAILKSSENILCGNADSVQVNYGDVRAIIRREFLPINLHAQDIDLLRLSVDETCRITSGNTHCCFQDETNSVYIFLPLRTAVHSEYNLTVEDIASYLYEPLRTFQILSHITSTANDSGMIQLTGTSSKVRCRLLNARFKKNSLIVITEDVQDSPEVSIQFFTTVENLLNGLNVFKPDEEAQLIFREDCIILRSQNDSIEVILLNRNSGTWL